MTLNYICCMFLLANIYSFLNGGCTQSISKSVCLGESIRLFENITLSNATIVLNQIIGDDRREIAKWTQNESTVNSSIHRRYESRVSLDKHGTIWMTNVRTIDKANYIMVYTDKFGGSYYMEVELIVMDAPKLHCKPLIKSLNNELYTFVNVSVCGIPPVLAYWLGYGNKTMISVKPETYAGQYHACVQGPALRCSKIIKATSICSSSRKRSDVEMQPNIYIKERNIQERYITLQCQLKDKADGELVWRRNGIIVTNNAKYSTTETSLTIHHLNNDDIYDIYTCIQPGRQFESNLYSIEASGPSFLRVTPSLPVVKEQDTLNVTCFTDCYPLCSVSWSKIDPVTGHAKVILENDILQLTNATRELSGNYKCKVQNLIIGTSMEDSISLYIEYGPDNIFLNTTSSIVELDEYDSIALLCRAECFPPCFVTWNEGDEVNNQTGYAELNLMNVTSNGTYTCRAWNPSLYTLKLSKTINLVVKLDETLIPKISLLRSTASDASVVLHCHSFRRAVGRFYWMSNSSLIKRSDKYSPENDFLYVRHITAEDINNIYTCKEPGSNFNSEPFRFKPYGPHYVFLNTSENKSEVYLFSSTTVVCAADCFPPCLFRWIFSYTNTIIEGPYLSLENVTNFGTLTCHVNNPIDLNQTLSKSINVIENLDKDRNTITSGDTNQDRSSTTTGLGSLLYLLHVVPVTGVCVATFAVLCWCRMKTKHCSCTSHDIHDDIHAHPDEVENNQEEIISNIYWEISPNIVGEHCTVGETDNAVEVDLFVNPAANITPIHQTSKAQETVTHSYTSDTAENDASRLDYIRSEGYINPIHFDPMQFSANVNPQLSHSNECNEYIHPVSLNTFLLDSFNDHDIADYKEVNGSNDDPFP